MAPLSTFPFRPLLQLPLLLSFPSHIPQCLSFLLFMLFSSPSLPTSISTPLFPFPLLLHFLSFPPLAIFLHSHSFLFFLSSPPLHFQVSQGFLSGGHGPLRSFHGVPGGGSLASLHKFFEASVIKRIFC